MTPKFEAWQIALGHRDTLLLNLTIIVLSWFSVWVLHLRKSKRWSYIARIGAFFVFYATLVLAYFADQLGL